MRNANKSKKFTIRTPRVKLRAAIYASVTVLLGAALVFSIYNIIKWRAEADAEETQIAEIQAKTEITEFFSISEIKNDIIPADDPYWTAQTAALTQVDLTESLKTNSETVGWIQVPGTNINYPFVQTTNNEFYLTHSFTKSWTTAGWVFLDYRNSAKLDDKNQILYAHGRLDGTMFGSLKNVLTSEWQENSENQIIKISTVTESSNWQVFSVYQIPTTSDYLAVNFESGAKFEEFLEMILARSAYDFKTKLTSADRILTLSTCGENDTRIVLHARLLKTETVI